MASDISFVEYVCEQAQGVPSLSYKKMFGEYGIYVGDKIVGLVCDNQFFVKPTTAGRALLKTPIEAPAYPGAKPYFVIDTQLDDDEFIVQLLIATENELPAPRPKKAKASRNRK